MKEAKEIIDIKEKICRTCGHGVKCLNVGEYKGDVTCLRTPYDSYKSYYEWCEHHKFDKDINNLKGKKVKVTKQENL